MSRNWSVKDQAQFYKRLGDLIQNGYHVQEALEFFRLSDFLSRKKEWGLAISDLKSGKTLYSILRDWNFHSDLIIFTMIAERHGDLGEALVKGSDLLVQVDTHKSKMRKMCLYPLFLLVISFGLFGLMCIWLLPQFESLYSQSTLESPWILKLLLFLKDDFLTIFLYLTLFLLFVIVISPILKRNLTSTKVYSFLSAVPFLGSLLKLYQSYFFSYQWSVLLEKGLSYIECVTFMKEWEEKPLYQEMSIRMKEALSRGDSLSIIIKKEKVFLKELPFLIEHGQKNGKIEREFSTFSSFCFEKLEKKLNTYSSLIQPVCFSAIGLVVILLYVSIMLPVIQMLQGI
ncbi:competence type IV pilus assembly protein ComGB [Bacillus carboniphilus]|uniref:competence type IV pilus assembly protein ComGB n=1 Tax=Bacillus carboniphilus TaxID=86663 RepID=UPI0031DE3DC0